MNRVFFLILTFAFSQISFAAPVALPGKSGSIRIFIDQQEIDGVVKHEGNRIRWNYQDITYTFDLAKKGDADIIKVSGVVPKSSSARYRMRLIYSNTARLPGNVEYFNGAKEVKLETSARRDHFYDTFPLFSVYNREHGIAIGITPDSVVGEFFSEAEKNGEEATLRVIVPVVLDNLKEQAFDFIHFDYTPEFAWRNALETYYNLYPEWFRAADGINPQIYGIGGYYLSAGQQHPLQLHSGRISRLDWEWTYAPWIEAGNWYTTPEQWVEGKSNIRNFHRYRQDKKGTYQEFRQNLDRQFDVGSRRAAMYFYILVKDMMRTLGDQYPDSRFADANGNDKMNGALFSIAENKDKTYFVWAPGTGLWDHAREQLKLCVENYKIDGFAFDMANFSNNDYGKGQLNYAVGRSFDEDGKIFSPDSILPIAFADYVHTLKSFRGERMSVYMNQALVQQSAFSAFHADGLMFEGGPDAEFELVRNLRIFSGRKPLTFWGGISSGLSHNCVDWAKIDSPELKAKTMRGLATMLLLKCYQYGMSPMNWAVIYDNSAFFSPHLKPLISLKKAGWNPVSAIRGKNTEKLYLGRFGYGKNTLLTISNPQREPVTAEIEILTGYFGGGNYLVAPDCGTELVETVSRGVVRLELTLAPKEVRMFSVLPFTGADPARFVISGNAYQKCRIRNESAKAVELECPPSMPDSSVLDKVAVNGEEQPAGTRLELPAQAVLELEYEAPTVIFPDEKSVFNVFRFADQMNGKNKVCMVVPENPSREVETVKIMVDRYYPFCYASKLYCGKSQTHEAGFLDPQYTACDPISIGRQIDPERKNIIVGTLKDFPEYAAKLPPALILKAGRNKGGFLYSPQANTLWIGGCNDDDLKQASNRYFELLDAKR